MKQLHISPELSLPLDWMSLATVVYGARGDVVDSELEVQSRPSSSAAEQPVVNRQVPAKTTEAIAGHAVEASGSTPGMGYTSPEVSK